MNVMKKIIVGTPVKLSHVLIGMIVVVLLSLFLTGFGYQAWWLFLIVLILGVFVTLPTCFNPYWQISSENITIINYDINDVIKLMQLLGLHKKSKQVINLSDVKKAAVVYRKNVRLSPIDFNPDYLNLILDLGKGTNMTLTLGNVDYQQLNSIMGLLQDKNIVVDDKQNILQLLRENKNLFNHFHKKGWTSL
ncbi:hypothetical protein HMPREF0508_01112 [Lactobacillus crispatus MV-3A-US]|nr:hypothetical protein HMPREF5045_00606 [Lactobacillus crispatus 125-2-CHN]EEX29350.1 hypothetical protein HMPREF0508_01112 [Lactobacillus crispatus MV-3A-US]